MIAECKRIRTKKGDPMMFATLDDLEGQVELLVFNSAYAANADKVDVDKLVIVRGRVDHKEAGETKLVAQEVEPFDPSEEEVLRATEEAVTEAIVRRVCLHVSPGVPDTFLEELKEVVGHHPGEQELLLAVGPRRLLLGPGVQGVRLERLPDRAVGAARRGACRRLSRPARYYTFRVAPIPARTSAELHECRQCCSFCDRVVHPSGCIASGCQYLYLYDDEETGSRFMGCMHKVFRGEIDVELFEQAERTRHGLRRREDDRPAATPVPLDRGARLRRLHGGLRLREPALLPQAGARGRDEAFDLRDEL